MDAFVDTLVQLLIDWGYVGLFISALLAGSIIPFSSELVMLALVKVGLNPAICVLAATLGNTMGGMTCYYMGHLGKTDWIEKYFKVKQEKIDKMQRFLQGQGRSEPGTVRTLRHLGKYAGRHDVLLHGTSGTYRLD